jgi:hypothetical protein
MQAERAGIRVYGELNAFTHIIQRPKPLPPRLRIITPEVGGIISRRQSQHQPSHA